MSDSLIPAVEVEIGGKKLALRQDGYANLRIGKLAAAGEATDLRLYAKRREARFALAVNWAWALDSDKAFETNEELAEAVAAEGNDAWLKVAKAVTEALGVKPTAEKKTS